MAGLSTLAAASGAVQGLQQGTQSAEDTKRFLASLLQQQQQFDVTSGLESRKVGALEQRTGAEVRQAGAETDIKKATLQDMNLTHKTKLLLYNAFVDANIAPKQAEQMATKAAADTLTNKRNIMTTQSAMDYLEQDPELARDIGLAKPRQEVAAARGAEAGATAETIRTGALPTSVEQQQEAGRIAIDAARFKLDSAKSMFPLQSAEAEQSIENMIVQHNNMIKSGLFTEAKTVAQNIENMTAEALANAQAENIAARTGLTEAQTSAIATELAQGDKRLSLLDKQLQLQYSQVDKTQRALTPTERNNINSEINRLRAELVAASLDGSKPLIEAHKRQLELQYARLGYTPTFTDTKEIRRLKKDIRVVDVSNLIPFSSDDAIISSSPRAAGGDTESQVRTLFEQGKQSEALDFGRKNGLDDATINRIRNEVR